MRGLLPLLLLLACDAPTDRDGYLTDPASRRAELEAALWQPDLRYSRGLLANYALPEGGWELLPLQSGVSAPLTTTDAAALAAGRALTLDAAPLPTETDDRVALGRAVFERLPMRSDAYVTWLASRPDLWEEVGLPVEGDRVRGLVKYRARDGAVQVGIACALCHGADQTPGKADRRLDLGRARQLFNAAYGIDSPLELDWGPGRVDVSEDGVDAPFAIPDLWTLRDATWLNHAGVLQIHGPATLAIRFETQYIKGHRMGSRPHRLWTWALAQYLLTLSPPPPLGGADPADAAVFAQRCAGCHDPDRGYAGGLVPAEALHVDPRAANSPTRGTGYYKVPSLRGVRHAAPYLHDGSAPDLSTLLAEGHPVGQPLGAAEQAALIRFLQTL